MGEALNWHETPKVRSFLDRLDPDQLYVGRQLGICGPDRYVIRGEAVELLEDMRSAFVGEAFGCTFLEAERHGRANEWLALYQAQPDARTVLALHFGDPDRFGGWSEGRAQSMWREAAKARLAEGVAA